MIELYQILEGLIQRTADGKLRWSRTVESAQFVASLDAISVVIQEVGSRQHTHRLEILNEEGVAIEALDYSNSTEDQNRQLQRLYVLALRSALDIQSTLEKLARALEL